MIIGYFSIEEQMNVPRLRWSKSTKITVVDADFGMDILNVATNNRVYATNLGLSNKETQAKVAKSNGDNIPF